MKKYIDLDEFKKKFVCFGWSDQTPEEEIESLAVEGVLIPKEQVDEVASIFDGARSDSSLPDGLQYPYLHLTFENINGCYDESFDEFEELRIDVNTLFDRNILDKNDERSELFLYWDENEKYKVSLVPKFEDFNKEWNAAITLKEILYLEEIEGAPHLERCAHRFPYNEVSIEEAVKDKMFSPKQTIMLRAYDGSEVYLNVVKLK